MRALRSLGSIVFAVFMSSSGALAQGPPARGPGNASDMQAIHFLMMHRSQIHRTVTNLPNGVETLTESDDPAVAAQLRQHVRAMHDRMKTNRPIRLRDPLFAALFANADHIQLRYEDTPKGIRAFATSDDPYVAKLVQAHAAVVGQFLENGMSEMRANHPVPPRD